MIGLFTIVAVGFVLGVRHATDADHVVAITTIVSRQRNLARAALTGIIWGVGHTLTIFAVGMGIILFNLVIPPRLGLAMEFAVGAMLIILGILNIASSLRSRIQLTVEDSAAPSKQAHTDGHLYLLPPPMRTSVRSSAGTVRPLLVGVVHGLAGSVAIVLLVLASIRNPRWALAYLLVFGAGTVAGMMLITLSIASTCQFFGRSNRRLQQHLGLASGVVSLLFGVLLSYQIGYVDGLFLVHAHWIPR
jgi:high-affinity nickel-transport protein